MKKLDKKCPECSRVYRGEGYKDNCTSECYAKMEYKKKYPKVRVGKVDGDERRYKANVELNKQKKDLKNIKSSNENWTKTKKEISAKERNRINNLLETKHLRKSTEFNDKKFKTVRG